MRNAHISEMRSNTETISIMIVYCLCILIRVIYNILYFLGRLSPLLLKVRGLKHPPPCPRGSYGHGESNNGVKNFPWDCNCKFLLISCINMILIALLIALLESLSSTSDTNTDTNNMSCACSLLARSTRTSVLEVTTTEVGLVLEVGGIVR